MVQSAVQNMALIALGSNLGNSSRIICDAMARLRQLSAGPLLTSALWRSTPVDCPPGSPPFINAAVALTPLADETPHALLGKLQALESEFGRKRKLVLNEPRPLDLDLIAFGTTACSTKELALPHPRAHLRRFVLEPLNEIAPDFILPGRTQTIRQLLAGLGSPHSQIARHLRADHNAFD